MSNPLRDMIINEIVRPEIASAHSTYAGVIINKRSTGGIPLFFIMGIIQAVDVRLLDGTDLEIENVPLPLTSSVKDKDIAEGDKVIVSFAGPNFTDPYVVSVIRMDGSLNTTGKYKEHSDSTQDKDTGYVPLQAPSLSKIITGAADIVNNLIGGKKDEKKPEPAGPPLSGNLIPEGLGFG